MSQIEPRPVRPADHVMLVDGSGYMYRAYHALPPIKRKSDGLQLNAVLGFCGMLWKLLRGITLQETPTHIGVVFDKSRATFRTALYPRYQAHRPDAPSDLVAQFELLRAAVRAFGILSLEQDGYEADDLIATYTQLAFRAGARVTIVSSDKDFMQLVNDKVTLYDTMKDRKIGPSEVFEKFGVPPEKVVEVQALVGDPVDNVPGVPGIGVKTAAHLIREYGDLETLLKQVDGIVQKKRRLTLIENAETARLSRQLVRLNDSVELDVPIDELAIRAYDRRLISFLKAMEFETLVRRVSEVLGVDPSTVETATQFGASSVAPDDLPSNCGTIQGELFLEYERKVS